MVPRLALALRRGRPSLLHRPHGGYQVAQVKTIPLLVRGVLVAGARSGFRWRDQRSWGNGGIGQWRRGLAEARMRVTGIMQIRGTLSLWNDM